MVICVAHRPAGGVSFCLLAVRRVDKLAVVVGPFAKVIKTTNLLTKSHATGTLEFALKLPIDFFESILMPIL